MSPCFSSLLALAHSDIHAVVKCLNWQNWHHIWLNVTVLFPLPHYHINGYISSMLCKNLALRTIARVDIFGSTLCDNQVNSNILCSRQAGALLGSLGALGRRDLTPSIISCLSPGPPSSSGPQATARYTSTPLILDLLASFHFQTILLPKDIRYNNTKNRGKVRGKGRLYEWKDEKAQKEKVWGILKHRLG